MSTLQLLDAAGRRRSPATLPGFHAGRPPRNKGFVTRPTRLGSKRSSPSCAWAARQTTGFGYEH